MSPSPHAPLAWTAPPRRPPHLGRWFHVGSAAAAGAAMALAGTTLVSVIADRALPPSGLAAAGMGVLVNVLGFVLLRYSASYLGKDRNAGRFLGWMTTALAAVNLLLLTDNLLFLATGWLGASLALHRLLTHFAERPAAQVAAHKKFLVSRAADVAVFAAIGLLYRETGSLSVTDLPRIDPNDASAGVQAAALLFAAAAALKSAQIPFHGWITQVMEAPTPVSALLHAGVVNLGGLVLIRLSPLMVAAPAAQLFLVTVGSLTAVVAALVMTTRVSIKVSLAWSTIAQMGFMLVQCGLGAYGLAFLHLLAHSLYKAHAFLASGSEVERWGAEQLATPARPVPFPTRLAAAALSLLVVAGVGAAVGADPRVEPSLWPLGLVLGLALTPLFTPGARRWQRRFGAVAFAALSFAWHAAFGALVPGPEVAPGLLALVVPAVVFTAGFLLHAALEADPGGALASFLHPRLFAGLYLDELATRLTLGLWPTAHSTESPS